jgi:hypothetical protein
MVFRDLEITCLLTVWASGPKFINTASWRRCWPEGLDHRQEQQPFAATHTGNDSPDAWVQKPVCLAPSAAGDLEADSGHAVRQVKTYKLTLPISEPGKPASWSIS